MICLVGYFFSSLKLLVQFFYKSSQSSWLYFRIEQLSKWIYVLEAKVLAEKQGTSKYRWRQVRKNPVGKNRDFTVNSRSLTYLHIYICMYAYVFICACISLFCLPKGSRGKDTPIVISNKHT